MLYEAVKPLHQLAIDVVSAVISRALVTNQIQGRIAGPSWCVKSLCQKSVDGLIICFHIDRGYTQGASASEDNGHSPQLLKKYKPQHESSQGANKLRSRIDLDHFV